MTLNDVGLAFVDKLRRQRYDNAVNAHLVRSRPSRRDRRLSAPTWAGTLPGRQSPALIRMRDQGVTPDYIAGLARYGLRNLPAEQVVRLRATWRHRRLRRRDAPPRLSPTCPSKVWSGCATTASPATMSHARQPRRREACRPRSSPTGDCAITAHSGIGAVRTTGTRLRHPGDRQAGDNGVTDGYVGDLRDLGYSGLGRRDRPAAQPRRHRRLHPARPTAGRGARPTSWCGCASAVRRG